MQISLGTFLFFGALSYGALWYFFNKKDHHIIFRSIAIFIAYIQVVKFFFWTPFFTLFEKISYLMRGVMSEELHQWAGFVSVRLQTQGGGDLTYWVLCPFWFGILFLIIHNQIHKKTLYKLPYKITTYMRSRRENREQKKAEEAQEKYNFQSNIEREIELEREKVRAETRREEIRLEEKVLEKSRPQKEKNLSSILDKLDDL